MMKKLWDEEIDDDRKKIWSNNLNDVKSCTGPSNNLNDKKSSAGKKGEDFSVETKEDAINHNTGHKVNFEEDNFGKNINEEEVEEIERRRTWSCSSQ